MPDPSWNIVNDALSAAGGWTFIAPGTSSVSATTHDSRSVFAVDSGSENNAQIIGAAQQFSAFTDYTCEWVFTIDSVKDNSNIQSFVLIRDNTNTYHIIRIVSISSPTTAIYIQWGGGYTTYNFKNHWLDMTPGDWITIRVVNQSDTLHLYVNGCYYGGVAYGSGKPGDPPLLKNVIQMSVIGGQSNKTVYYDSMKLSTTKEEADRPGFLKDSGFAVSGGGGLNYFPASPNQNNFWFTSNELSDRAVRFNIDSQYQGADIPYMIPLVGTGDSDASALRCRQGSTTYALREHKLF